MPSRQRVPGTGRNLTNDFTLGDLPPALNIEHAEMVDRLYRSPASRATVRATASDPILFASLSRYAAEVAVESRAKVEHRWLPDLVYGARLEEWRALLSGPAAAPLLRAARRQLADRLDALPVARKIGEALDGQAGSLFDIDTAAGVASLAWRAGGRALCSLALDHIIRAAGQGVWRLLDIPTELWGDLAELLVSAAPEAVRHRPAFAELLAGEIRRFGGLASVDGIEVCIDALRIGAPSDDGVVSLAEAIGGTPSLSWGQRRRLFMLLLRCARENADHEAIRDIFSLELEGDFMWNSLLGAPPEQTLETLDAEAIALSLSYREAMDLRWALDIARQELPNQGAESQPSTPPRRPRKR